MFHFNSAFFTVLTAGVFLSNACGQSIGDPMEFPPDVFTERIEDGYVDVTLTLDVADHTSAAGTITNTRLFNGMLPGPTIRIFPGETLRVNFINNLVEKGTPVTTTNVYSHPEDTNLHYHGAHVSGELPSDDVTLTLSPGDSYNYESYFPDVHVPGTLWIHPHQHGSGALQVGGGAALALIVEDPVTFALPDEARNAPDHLLFVQQFDLTTTQNIERQSYQENNINNGLGSTGLSEYRLVNGMYQPTLTMKPNEWQRWRVVYGAWDAGALNLEVDTGCEMALLAKDSIYISDFPRIITQAAIPPGGRADIMVRCDDTATSYTVTHFNGDTLFTIDMEAVGVTATDLPSWSLPLPDYLEDVLNEPVDNACNCETALEGGSLTINGQDFDPTVFIHTVELGKAVERTVRGIGAHPYHQHVYPFQLVDNINDNTGYFQRGDWHDVIMMTGFAQTNIRYLPTRFLGRLMLHCHRLDHEDRGMMSAEEVLRPGQGGCQCDALYQRPETSSPTAWPTGSPTRSPTASTGTSSPTGSPTQSPSFVGSSSPTRSPTSHPTASPNASNNGNCLNDPDWWFTGRNGNLVMCAQVSPDRGNSCSRQGEGDDTRLASVACPVSCGTCTTSGTASPTTSPTRSPTFPPTGSPTLGTNAPTRAPTRSPTFNPTGFPTTAIPTSLPTTVPTRLPTTDSPTGSPSTALPTAAPTQGNNNTCQNDPTWSARTPRGHVRTCNSIDPNRACDPNRGLRDASGVHARDACPQTCGLCN